MLLHIAKHRGFRSTRKAETAAKENGAVLKATDENQKRMQEKGYRTVGEMIYLDEAFRTGCSWSEKGYILTPRNKAENYQHTMLRAMLVEEVKEIFSSQRRLGNEKATEELEEKYLEVGKENVFVVVKRLEKCKYIILTQEINFLNKLLTRIM